MPHHDTIRNNKPRITHGYRSSKDALLHNATQWQPCLEPERQMDECLHTREPWNDITWLLYVGGFPLNATKPHIGRCALLLNSGRMMQSCVDLDSDGLDRCASSTFTNRVERQCQPHEAKGLVPVQGEPAGDIEEP